MKNRKKPFAFRFQQILIILLILSFILIGQKYSILVYKFGIILLIISTLIQIPFGNIKPDSSFKSSMVSFSKMFLVIIIIFVVGIIIAPYLINMGRG